MLWRYLSSQPGFGAAVPTFLSMPETIRQDVPARRGLLNLPETDCGARIFAHFDKSDRNGRNDAHCADPEGHEAKT